MGCCNGLTRHRASPGSSVMLRRLRRLRVTAIFYTCGGLCAILLLVNFNEDVKRLLQQSSSSSGPHLSSLTRSHQVQDFSVPLSSQSQSYLSHTTKSRKVPPFPNTIVDLTLKNTISLNDIIEQSPIDLDLDLEKDSSPLSFQMGLITSTPTPQGTGMATGSSQYLQDQNQIEPNHPEKLWYMWGGTKFPSLTSGVPVTSVDEARLWYEDNLNNDRIIDQLMFWIDDPINNPNTSWLQEPDPTGLSTQASVDKSGAGPIISQGSKDYLASIALSTGSVQLNYNSQNDTLLSGSRLSQPRGKLKTILLYYGLGMSWGAHVTSGRSAFLHQKCPVNACRLTGNRAHLTKADVVLFKDVFMNPKVKRNPSQLWVMYMLECPLNTQNFVDKNVFNLTATYRHDSDIVTPYEKWVYYDNQVKTLKQGINYAEGKTKKVAWFVSNCVAKNNRLDYARELSKYIEVDIYGACGTHSCSRANAKQCFDLLATNYKFYLAFENSNCRDYISEKFFVNGLGNNVLPIVMGAHPDDYKRVAPAKSYIHVDDFASPKELAEYLYLLDSNNELYNEYFGWKGTGEFINTHFFCRLCAMAHYADKSERKPRHYQDFNQWWRGPHVCTRRSWRNQPDIFDKEHYQRQTVDS